MTIEEQKSLKAGDRIWHTGMTFEGKCPPFEPCWIDITTVTAFAICGRPDGQPNMHLCILHDDNPVDNKARAYYRLTKPEEPPTRGTDAARLPDGVRPDDIATAGAGEG